MICQEIKGSKNSALVFTNIIEDRAEQQIKTLLDQDLFANSQVRIMNDCHFGAGCVIGFTAKVKDAIVPNLVGVDISCRISAYKLNTNDIDLKKLDDSLHLGAVPSGMYIRKTISDLIPEELKQKIKNVNEITTDKNKIKLHNERDLLSIGTLGGGNHFIEIDKDKEGQIWLMVHSGSRNFGKRICDYFQSIARQKCNYKGNQDNDLSFIEGKDLEDYIYCSKVAGEFAEYNHKVISQEILKSINYYRTDKVDFIDEIHTKHNYIEFLDNNEMMIRKGAISAKENEKILIPVNMAEGTLIAIGKGNDNRNQSAPHGAGRILSRRKAKELLSLEKAQEQMKNIFTTSLNKNTLDEAPDAYKPIDNLLNNLDDTATIQEVIKPIYNFKANN
jgi:RNA-splicing ligase RtcB